MKKLFQNQHARLLISAVAILLLTAFLNQNFFESYKTYFGMDQTVKYLLNLVGIILVAIIGYWAWYYEPRHWLRSLWVLVYGLFVIIFLLYGVVDRYIFPISLNAKAIFRFYRGMLFSPLPFMLLFILSMVFRQDKKDQPE